MQDIRSECIAFPRSPVRKLSAVLAVTLIFAPTHGVVVVDGYSLEA